MTTAYFGYGNPTPDFRDLTVQRPDFGTNVTSPTVSSGGRVWLTKSEVKFGVGRESMKGVKLIPPCSLRKFAFLTCSAHRGIKKLLKMILINYFVIKF